MFNHQPSEYTCPFCRLLSGVETEFNMKQDVVYENEHTIAFVAPRWWENNKGHVLVVPRGHYENIYEIPDDMIGEVYKTVKKIAIAIRSTYECDGTSTRQHNEPAGDQDVWHLHAHVFPRFTGDELYKNSDANGIADAAQRLPYAEKLRAYFAAVES
jgi:histidine triad (HIT) family protein